MAREFDRDSDRTSVAREFDGSDDTIDLGTVADSDQSLTLMTWVKPDVVNVNLRQRIITKADGNVFNNGSLLIGIKGDGTARLVLFNNGNTISALGPTIAVNEYTHVAGRYNFQTGSMTLFVNGQPVSNNSPGQLPALSTQPWRLGEDNPAGNADEFLDGTVDDTRIYTAALSDAEIRQIYRQTQPEQPVKPVASENLVAWYPFRRDSALDHTTLTDIPVGDRTAYDGTVRGANFKPSGGVTDIQTGANSGAFRFDGADDDIQIANAPGLNFGTRSFSISLAIKPDKLGVAEGVIEKIKNGAFYQLFKTNEDRIALQTDDGGTLNDLRLGINTTSFVRVTAVRDAQAGELRLFIGSSSASKSVTVVNVSNGGNLLIGNDRTAADASLDGVLDDVRLYNTALTQSQHDEIRSNTT